MLREGTGEPIVLLHGVMGAEVHWRHVAPKLAAAGFEAIVPNALGHLGGREPVARPVTMADIVDDAERTLDELGLKRPHLAGNSMGGWMALELMRRGRARSVTAFSPAGAWELSEGRASKEARGLLRAQRDARIFRPLLPLIFRSARVRRTAMQLNAVHGERLDRDHLLGIVDASIGCTVVQDVIDATGGMEPLDSLPCPVVIRWSDRDRVLPHGLYEERIREVHPGADFGLLTDVGHVPMFDDPELVASIIIETARVADSAAIIDAR